MGRIEHLMRDCRTIIIYFSNLAFRGEPHVQKIHSKLSVLFLVTVTSTGFVVPTIASADSNREENTQVNKDRTISGNGSLDEIISQVDQNKTTDVE